MTKPSFPFLLLAFALLGGAFSDVATAQYRPHHDLHSADLPPGAIGRDQLQRGGPLPGYFQPVRIEAPPGVSIALIENGQFVKSKKAPIHVGMLIGQVYRFKVTGIPQRPGDEVYPTIEVINRLYPPPGQKVRFSIPVQLTQEELDFALNGSFVTRVIYLENPNRAFPEVDPPGFQRYFEVQPKQDPLEVADTLGRPMAILRMGSRVPDLQRESSRFYYGSPPLINYPPPREEMPHELKVYDPAEDVEPPLPEETNQNSDAPDSAATFDRRTPADDPDEAPPRASITDFRLPNLLFPQLSLQGETDGR